MASNGRMGAPPGQNHKQRHGSQWFAIFSALRWASSLQVWVKRFSLSAT